MKFNTKSLALTSGILWGLAMLVMGLANLIWGNYGQQFLQTMSSVYPATMQLAASQKSSSALFMEL